MLDLGPDAPRWATADGAPARDRDRQPRARPARVRATSRPRSRKRYSGDFEGLPTVRVVLALERAQPPLLPEAQRGRPAHLPARWSPRRCRALRDAAGGDAQVLVGETAPDRRPGSVLGPRDFLRRWLCLDERFQPTPDEPGCRGFRGFDVDGYAHHPYGPDLARRRRTRDIVSMLVIRRLGRYLDRARGGRAAAAEPADLQHRVRPPVATLPIRPRGINLARAGGAPEREGGAVVPLPAPAQLRAVPAVRRPAARGRHAAGDLVGLPDRPALPRRHAEARLRRLPAADRGAACAAAAACASGAGCGPGAVCGGRSSMRGGRVVRRVETNDAGYFEVTLPDRAPTASSGYDGDGQARWAAAVTPVPLRRTPSSD